MDGAAWKLDKAAGVRKDPPVPYVAPLVLRSQYFEDDDIVTMWRPRHADGTLVIDSLVDDWDLNVYVQSDTTVPLTPVYTLTAQAVAGIMFSSAQTPALGDAWWDEDPGGYTFRHTLEYADRIAALTPFVMQGGKVYRLEYVLNLAAGGRINGLHFVDTLTKRS